MNYDQVKDSGSRQEFSTGAVRDTPEGKGRYDLLPAYAIGRIARHFENGARKYEDNNWRKGIPLTRFLDSALRHLFKFSEGYRDEDHLAAAAWNILALIETEEMAARGIVPEELVDLPDYTAPAPSPDDGPDPALNTGECSRLDQPGDDMVLFITSKSPPYDLYRVARGVVDRNIYSHDHTKEPVWHRTPRTVDGMADLIAAGTHVLLGNARTVPSSWLPKSSHPSSTSCGCAF